MTTTGSTYKRSPGNWLSPVAVTAAMLVLVAATAGCGGGTAEPTSTTTSTAPVETTVSTTTTTDAPTTTAPEPDTHGTVTISEASLTYAEDLGGTSHKGQEFYFIIGATADSVDAAQIALEDAIPSFGDMQSYFIVQISDNFDGMEPGRWVIIEAYRDEPSNENLEFARRAFPEAQVVKATVRTSDPIPVYEEMLGM